MGTKVAFWASLVVAGAMSASGCSHFRPVENRRNHPYQSPMLNHEFASAYPRNTDLDLFAVTSGSNDSSHYASSDSDSSGPDSFSAETSGWEQDGSVHVSAADSSADESAPTVVQQDDTYSPRASAGYATAVYAANETPTGDGGDDTPNIADIYRHTQRAGTVYHATRPAVGDLVFFHNTFDRNGDGRTNDWYTHIGVVEGVGQDGTVSILSYLDDRVSRTYLNLEQPETARSDDGVVVNTTMRRASSGDPEYTQYLASELFAGFGSLLGDRPEFLVIDNWQPGMNVAALE